MPTYDININLTEKFGSAPAGQRPTRSSDSGAALNTLAKTFQTALDSQAKKIDASLKKVTSDAKAALRATAGKDSKVELDVKELARAYDKANKTLGNQVTKSLHNAINKSTTPGGISQKEISNAIERGLKNAADKIGDAVAKGTRVTTKSGQRLDPHFISSAISSAVEKSLKPLTKNDNTKVLQELTRVLSGLQTSLRRLESSKEVAKTAGSKAQPSLKETRDLLNSMSKINAEFRAMSTQVTATRKALEKLGVDPNVGTKQVQRVRQAAKKDILPLQASMAFDPNKMASVIAKAVEDAMTKAKSDPKMKSEVAELRKVIAAMPKEIKGGNIGKEWQELTRALDNLSKQSRKMMVKLIVDDSELRKVEKRPVKVKAEIKPDTRELDKVADKPIEVEASIKPETKELYNSLKMALDAAIKQFDNMKLKPTVEPVVDKLLQLKATIDKSSMDEITRQIGAITQAQDLQFAVDLQDEKAKAKLFKLKEAFSDLYAGLSMDVGSNFGKINFGQITSGITKTRQEIEKLNQAQAKNLDLIDKTNRLTNARNTAANRNAAVIHSSTRRQDFLTRQPMFRAGVLGPEGHAVKNVPQNMSAEARKIKADADKRISDLSKSLKKLQSDVITNLEKQFEELSKSSKKDRNWQIVRPGGATNEQLFQKTGGGRQWSFQIANIDKLTRAINKLGDEDLIRAASGGNVPADQLLQMYKERAAVSTAAEAPKIADQSRRIAEWVKNLTDIQIESAPGLQGKASAVRNLKKIRKAYSREEVVSPEMTKAVESAFGSLVTEIFTVTSALETVNRRMQQDGLVRNVALPAANINRRGTATFKTIHGSERVLPKFAKFETGFEVLYQNIADEIKKQSEAFKASGAKGKFTPSVSFDQFSGRIKDKPLRPGPNELADVNKLAQDMMRELLKSSDPGKVFDEFKGAFSDAIKVNLGKRQAQGYAPQDVENFRQAFVPIYQEMNKMAPTVENLNMVFNKMEAAGVSAYDAIRTLENVKSLNVYDVINEVLTKGSAPLQALGANPSFDRSIRNFEKSISEVEGLLPLLESNRPRRAYHQENVVNLLTRTSAAYTGRDRQGPDAQKDFIKDLNLRLDEHIQELKYMNKQAPTGLPRIQSLGIPESMAGNVQDLRPGGKSGSKFLENLNATQYRFYAEDLPSMAPFKKFQQAGRNIAAVSNAMVDLNQEFAESPLLRSKKERALIDSSRYGQGRYGFNVTAEMRNTAANFEDQIVIAGKLAKVFTEATKTLIKPSATGRLRASEQSKDTPTGVTKIRDTKIVRAELEKDVEKVMRRYMEILGKPEQYEGRADQAFVDSIADAMAVVRGEDIKVQQAVLTEKFLNYFGRKFTTRYGSKGVSVTPTGTVSDLPDILSKFAGSKIKVDPSATLGYTKTPKTIGQLAADLFGKDISDDLKKELILSGNKFIIDMFHKVGDEAIVTPDEAKMAQETYKKFADAWQKTFSTPVPTADVRGIEQIRSMFKGDEKALYDVKPIDVRISSYGAAKRGLQTEFMEAVFGNVAGIGQGAGATTVTDLKQPAYTKLLGAPGQAGALSQYSAALGYEGVEESQDEIVMSLTKFTKKRIEELKNLVGKDPSMISDDDLGDLEKYEDAVKAAILEKTSSFYSQIVTELGETRRSLVGPKFLQISEEPHKNPEWQRGQIERGAKGARLNLPAFSAYATVFGEQSAIIKEIQMSLDVNAKKHWEYLKALQTVNEEDSEIYDELTKNLRTVDIGQLQKFEASTGVYGQEYPWQDRPDERNPRSFTNTILDVDQYPDPFKLRIPTGRKTAEGAPVKEDIYVPGALARGTYPEPLIAGEYGMDQMARRLTHLSNMAKDLNDFLTNPEAAIENLGKVFTTISNVVGSMTKRANEIAKAPSTPGGQQELQDIYNRLAPAVGSFQQTAIGGEYFNKPADQVISSIMSKNFDPQGNVIGKTRKGGQEVLKSYEEAMAYIISSMSDVLIGKSKTDKYYSAEATTALKKASEGNTLLEFGATLGIDFEDEELNKRINNLQRAKVEYYNSLAETALGKQGSINELLFSRKIPAVMGKAVVAVTDKRKDIDKFEKTLRNIEEKYAGTNIAAVQDLGSVADDTRKAFGKHAASLRKYKEAGIPTLAQDQLGVPETFAEKIPLEFQRAKVVKGQLQINKDPSKGTLLDLLRETQKFEKMAFAEGDSDLGNKIRDYIDNYLVTYIESIRFPFTGTSSLAPYKPKLIGGGFRDQTGKSLESNALIVPGVPEGLEGLDDIIKDVKGRIDTLSAQRESAFATGRPQEEIDKLTEVIRALSAAVAEVIPKYTAQAQKLDFDGDQIEIHAAKTAEARKNIQEHFKQFHTRTSEKDMSTADVFRDFFLADAVQPSTGDFLMAESRRAFGKKFPGESFDFMKSPFLTKELEYLQPSTALETLSEKTSDGRSLFAMVEQIINERIHDQEEIERILSKLDEADPNDAAALTKVINELPNKTLSGVITKGIKSKLYEEKFRDTIEAQLFKIHTGPETEGLYGLQRVAESNIGFGKKGMLGGAEGFRASDYFKSRYPEGLKALGEDAAGEFHTYMNEILRFGIQKGMDVKHAGQKPIAGEMVGFLTRGMEGAQDLYAKVLEDGSYKELKEFGDKSAEAIRTRLGGMKTPDIAKEARMILESRGEGTASIDDMTIDANYRENLKNLIVEKVGLKGFLEEMSLLIKKEAAEGLAKQAREWTPAVQASPKYGLDPVTGDIDAWARGQIDKQAASDRGINLSAMVTQGKQGLYQFRTYGSSTGKELEKYHRKYGGMSVPDEMFSALREDQMKGYKSKYKKAVATAKNVKDQLQAFNFENQGGAYSEMVRTTIDTMYADQAKLNDIVSELEMNKYDPKAAKSVDLFERAVRSKGLSTFAQRILASGQDMSKQIEEYSEIAGIPELSTSEVFATKKDLGAPIRDYVTAQRKSLGQGVGSAEDLAAIEKSVETYLEKANAIKQIDRVIDAMTARSSELAVLQKLIPKSRLHERITTKSPSQRDAIAAFRAGMKKPVPQGILSGGAAPTTPNAISAGMGGAGRPGGTMPAGAGGTGGVVPVHIVSADPSVTINVKGLQGAGYIQSASPAAAMRQQSELQKEMESNNAELKSIIAKTRGTSGPKVSMEEFFSPSRLEGGGIYPKRGDFTRRTEAERFEGQVQELMKKLQGDRTTSMAGDIATDWGQALHSKLEEYLKTDDKVNTEVYEEKENAIAGMIGGTADILEYATADKEKITKIADIKSIKPEDLAPIEAAVKKLGSTDINDVLKELDAQLQHKLQGYFSQLNTYLEIFDSSAQAEIRFYDKERFAEDPSDFTAVTFSFDPERFKRDMEALAEARRRIKAEGGAFGQISRGGTAAATGASIEELDKAMKLAQRQAFLMKQGVRMTAPRRDDSDIADQIARGASRAAEFAAAQRSADKRRPIDYSYISNVPEPNYGKSPFAFFENLKNLHQQASIFQSQRKGLDPASLGNLPKELQTALSSVETEGPDYQTFIDLTTAMKEDKSISYGQFIKAWKAYRIEVGNWMIARAEQAKAEMDEFQAAGDIRGTNAAMGKFEGIVDAFQERIRRSVGKQTDIYTDQKQFIYPKLAQAAGVFKSPDEIIKGAAEPLGEDPKLIEQFNKITTGITESSLKAPVDVARDVFRDLSEMNTEMIDLLNNSEKLKRLGPGVIEAMDFGKLAPRVTRLRSALQDVLKEVGGLDAEQKKALDSIIKYLKNLEGLTAHRNFGRDPEYGFTGARPVPKFESAAVQNAAYESNIRSIEQYFRRPEEAGGPKIGDRLSYPVKITGEGGEVIKNQRVNFYKYGETIDETGEKVGQFSMRTQDLIEKMQKSNATFSNAIRRVVMWGAASRLVYGGISNLKSSLDELAEIEVSMAQLRMVMNPLTSDFAGLSKSATGFAKQYGVPVTDVLKSMKVFAQQGLKQEEIVDRTQTATLASNVTTLNAKEATEALTAAMKVFREEGTQSLRFLDAWSETEAKQAITAEDMANAIKKSAAAAKTAGFQFDQLNGIVAAIGSVTRQSGKEVGTSLRFIFRRLFSEEGPKALAKLDIPVLQDTGNLRSGFDVLSDLAGAWDDMTQAQKLNVAQSIGGTRQYNSLLVLMDNWDEALKGISNSTNSKGSAERRNLEIMKTYSKQLQQTRAAATELKMELGKFILPVFKGGLTAAKTLTEAFTAIPNSLKAAGALMALFVGYAAKGYSIVDGIVETFGKGESVIGSFLGSFKDQLKIGKFEIFGKGSAGFDTSFLKTVTKSAADLANAVRPETGEFTKQGQGLSDFNSSLGQVAYMAKSAGEAFNEFVANVLIGTGDITSNVGKFGKEFGSAISVSGSLLTGDVGVGDAAQALQQAASAQGLGREAVRESIRKYGVKAVPKLLGNVASFVPEAVGFGSALGGKFVDAFGEQVLGAGGQKILKDFVGEDTGLAKAIAPLAATTVALVPAMSAIAEEWGRITKSASDYEKAMDGARKATESELKDIRSMASDYDALVRKVEDIRKVSDPAVKARRQDLETYTAPLTSLQSVQTEVTDLSNRLASENINLVAGYDALGNAVLKTTDNFRKYLSELDRLKTKDAAQTEVDILDKFITDLSQTDGPERWKKTIKDLLESAPIFGDLAARNIKRSPAALLEEASGRLNKAVALKNKYPLSTAADEDLKELQGKLMDARKAYQGAFGDFERIYGGIVAPGNLRGLSSKEIQELLSSDTLKKAYELRLKVNPKFSLVAGVTAEDIMGKEILSALNPRTSGFLDATAEFTKANLESAGIKAREGILKPGDIVTFIAGDDQTREMAGRQAIVKVKETADGVYEWVAQYFNTTTLQIEERAFDKNLESLVDNIFPVQRIQEDISYRMDALNTFLTGAGAGLVGVDAKAFKADFNLGERFFGNLPTSTLIQTGKGFNPFQGFGDVNIKSNWAEEIDKYFFKPMEEFRRRTDDLGKLQLEGLQDVSLSRQLFEELTNLNDLLQNNQIALQFRALYADLEKTFAEGDRVLKEGLAVNESRRKFERESGGLNAGISKTLTGLDLGTYKTGEVTAQQRLLAKDSGFEDNLARIQDLETTTVSLLERLDAVARASSNIDVISDQARGFGAQVTSDNIDRFIEKIDQTGEEAGLEKLITTNDQVEVNTSNTVARLDDLINLVSANNAAAKKEEEFVSGLASGGMVIGKGHGTQDSNIRALSNGEFVMKAKAVQEIGQQTLDYMNKHGKIPGMAAGGLVGGTLTATGGTLELKLSDKNIGQFADILEKAARTREGGDQDTVVAMNKVIGNIVSTMVSRFGFKDSIDAIDNNFTLFSKKFTSEEFAQKAFGGADLEMVLDKMSQFADKPTGGIFGIGQRSALKDSSELAKLRQLQEGDGKRSIVSARNIAKVSAAMFALTTLQKSGNKEIVSNLENQISKLDEQIEEGKLRGLGEPQLRDLFVKREGLQGALEQRTSDVDFYGMVQSLSGLTTIASELAASFGLTEKQVKMLGGGALATLAAVQLSSKVLGKEMPESAKVFKDEVVKIAKKKIAGEDVGLRDLAGFKSAASEFTKEIKSKTKDIFDRTPKQIQEELNEKKLGKAYAEEEGKYTDLIKKTFGKRVASEGELAQEIAKAQGAGPKKLQQAIAAYLAATFADFAAKRNEDKQLLSTLESRMDRQSEVLGQLLLKYPDAAQAALDDFQQSTEEATTKVSKSFRTESKLLDADTEKQRISDAIQSFGDTTAAKYEEVMKEIVTRKAIAAYETFAEELSMSIENRSKSLVAARDTARLEGKFGANARLNSQLSGFQGENPLPLGRQDMSAQQRVFADSSKYVKYLISSFAEANVQMDSLVTSLDELQKQAREQEEIISSSNQPEVVKRAKEFHSQLTDEIDRQTNMLSLMTDRMQEFGEAQRNLINFSDAIYKFNDAMREVAIAERVQDIPGYRQFQDSMDMLFGGGHPLAGQEVSPELERMGDRVGVRLVDMVSNQFEIERARILDRMRTTDSSEELTNLAQQLQDLPVAQGRAIRRREQMTENDRFRRQMEPFNELLSNLERAQMSPGLSSGRVREIESLQQNIVSLMGRSTERVSRETKLEELNDQYFKRMINPFAKNISFGEYLKERESIQTGGEMQYRGISLMDRRGVLTDQFRNIRQDLVDAMKDAPTLDMLQMEASITDPIVSELQNITALLSDATDIGPEDLSMLVDKFFEKRGENFASGGKITGPGGPKDDKIPARLSAGEFVMKTSSARKLGYDALNFMNKTGSLPGYQDGGPVTHDFEAIRNAILYANYEKAVTPDQGILGNAAGSLRQFRHFLRDQTGTDAAGNLVGPLEAAAQSVAFGVYQAGSGIIEAFLKTGQFGIDSAQYLYKNKANPVKMASDAVSMIGNIGKFGYNLAADSGFREGIYDKVKESFYSGDLGAGMAGLAAEILTGGALAATKAGKITIGATKLGIKGIGKGAGLAARGVGAAAPVAFAAGKLGLGATFQAGKFGLSSIGKAAKATPKLWNRAAEQMMKAGKLKGTFAGAGRAAREGFGDVRGAAKQTFKERSEAASAAFKEGVRGAREKVREAFPDGLKANFMRNVDYVFGPKSKLRTLFTPGLASDPNYFRYHAIRKIAEENGLGMFLDNMDKTAKLANAFRSGLTPTSAFGDASEIASALKHYIHGSSTFDKSRLLDSILKGRISMDTVLDKYRTAKAAGTTNFAAGGRIFGEGGPTSDSILARVSNGEFVLNADASRKIGYGALEHMNKTGELPAFAEGGAVGKFFRNLSTDLSGFTDFLSDKRMKEVYRDKEGILDHIKSVGAQGGLAAVELAARLGNVVTGAGAGAEGVADYILSNDVDKIKSDIGMIAGGIKSQIDEKGVAGLTKDIGAGIIDAAKTDIKRGGLGITTGVMEAVSGVGLAKLAKTHNVGALIKSAGKDLVEASKYTGKQLLTSEVGAVGPGVGELVAKEQMKKAARKLKLATPDEAKLILQNTASPYNKDATGMILDDLAPDSARAKELLASPDFDKVAKYLPKNASYLGEGGEALVFDSGKGVVVRISKEVQDIPDIPGVLQPLKRIKAGEYGVDYFPKVDMDWTSKLDDMFPPDPKLPISVMPDDIKGKLQKQIEKHGYDFWDTHEGNIGVHKGEFVVIDPGAMVPTGTVRAQQEMLMDMFGPSTPIKEPTEIFDAAGAGSRLDELFAAEGFAMGGRIRRYQNGGTVERIRRTEMDEEDWGILTAMEANRRFRKADPVDDASGSFGLSAQYDTEMYRKAKMDQAQGQVAHDREKERKAYNEQIRKLNTFTNRSMSQEQWEIQTGQVSPVGYLSAEEFNALFVGDRSKLVHPSITQAKQAKEAEERTMRANLLTQKYDSTAKDAPQLNKLGTHVKPLKIAYDDASNLLAMIGKNPQDNEFRSAMLERYRMSQGLDAGAKVDMEAFEKDYKSKILLLQNQFDRTQKALEYVQAGGSDYLMDKEYRKLAKESEATRRVISSEFYASIQKMRDAKEFGSAEKAEKYQSVDPNLAAKYRKADADEREKMDAVFAELLDLRENFGRDLFQLDKKKYNEYRNRLIDAKLHGGEELSDEYKNAFIDHMKAKAEVSPEERKKRKAESTADLMSRLRDLSDRARDPFAGVEGLLGGEMGSRGISAAMVSAGRGEKLSEMMRQARSIGNDALYKRWAEAMAARGIDPSTTAARMNFLPRESLKQYKHGGVITKDGPIYAHGGEVILPQGFAEGGMLNDNATASLNTTVSIDASELENVLSNFVSSVGEKLEGQTVQVEKPDWAVPVEVPESMKVEVDVDRASTILSSTIAEALSNPIKVEAAGTQAVGGEKLDKLGEALQNMQDRLTTVKTDLENKIEIISASNPEQDNMNLDQRIIGIVDSKLDYFREDSQNTKQVAYGANSQIYRIKQELDYRIDELAVRLGQTMTTVPTKT